MVETDQKLFDVNWISTMSLNRSLNSLFDFESRHILTFEFGWLEIRITYPLTKMTIFLVPL